MRQKLTGRAATAPSQPADLGTLRSGGTSNATLRLETGGKSLEQRITALEASLRELEHTVENQQLALTSEINRVQSRIDAALKNMRKDQEEREAEELRLRKQSLNFQWAGIPFFLLGVIFSVFGNIANC